jgi:hypothetical protein
MAVTGRNKGRNPRPIEEETTEALGLENVRGFDRPMASGPRDVFVGKDELGNRIYRTLLGSTYTVRAATPDESKTTRAHVEDWVGEGMPLPSMEQVGEVAKALPGMVYDSMQDTLEGTATMGEAVGWAPGMQAASIPAKVPAGALRTGGGRNTENPKYNPLVMEPTGLEGPKTPAKDYLGELVGERSQGQKLIDAWESLNIADDKEDWVRLKDAIEFAGGDPTDIVKRFREDPEFFGNNEVSAFEFWVDNNEALPRDAIVEYDNFFSNNHGNPEGWDYASGGKRGPVRAEFYNPLRNGVENLDFGKNGLKGETIAAFLEKRVPKARASLLRSLDSGKGIFKPTQRYTQEEALGIIDQNFGKVYAEGANDWQDFQRMKFLENEERDYGEIVIRQDRDVPFKPGEDGTHYGDNAMAHARFSIRDDGAGGEMLVVEELQSDIVQKGFRSELPRDAIPDETMEEAVARRRESLRDILVVNYAGESAPSTNDPFEQRPFRANPTSLITSDQIDIIIEDVEKFLSDGSDTAAKNLLNSVPVSDEVRLELIGKYSDNVSQGVSPKGAVSLAFRSVPYRFPNLDKTEAAFSEVYQSVVQGLMNPPRPMRGKPASPGTSLPPIDSTTEFVRPLIYSLMREAKNRGINKVVIPNSDAFIEARKGQLGTTPAETASAKKAFQATYDKAVDKVLRELDREMGVDVNIEKTNLRSKSNRRLSASNEDLLATLGFAEDGSDLNESEFFRVFEQLAGSNNVEQGRGYYESILQEINNKGRSYPSRMISIGNLPEGKMRFAEGGLVPDMDKQMNFAFMNEGGMIDDGATVEPTTGNAVPPGSLKEEVADNIDTELPVGAYVVPADVLQYYGRKFFTDLIEKSKEEGAVHVEPKDKIKAKVSKGELTVPPGIVEHLGVAHFEKLRQKAKEGLAEMESNGRIGGDPVEDELPFSDEELMAEDVQEDGAQGFAAGGLAWNSPQMTGLTGTGTETITYVGPDGSKMPILFMNGQPIQQIPQGYVPEGQAKEQQAAFKSIRPGATKDEGQRPLNTMEPPKPMTEWAVEDFERYANSQGVMDIVTKIPAILGPGGAIMGGLLGKAYQMQGAKALEEIENRLAITDLDQDSKARLEATRDKLAAENSTEGGGLFGGKGLLGGLTGGGGLLEKMFGGGVKTTSEAPGHTLSGTRSTGLSPARTASPAGSGGGSSSAGLAPTSSPRPQANPTRSSAPSSTPASTNRTPSVSREQRDSIQEANKASGMGTFGGPSGGFAEGGFVKRRNK